MQTALQIDRNARASPKVSCLWSAQTSMNLWFATPQVTPSRFKPTEMLAPKNPPSSHFAHYQIISTNGPPIEKMKEHNVLGTSGAFFLSVADAYAPTALSSSVAMQNDDTRPFHQPTNC